MADDNGIEQSVDNTMQNNTGSNFPNMQGFAAESDSNSADAGSANAAMGGSVKPVRFSPISTNPVAADQNPMDLLYDVKLNLSVELGRASMMIKDVLQLGPGSIVELDKLSGEFVDIMVNGKLIAKGEVVVVDDYFGVRITEITSHNERIAKLS